MPRQPNVRPPVTHGVSIQLYGVRYSGVYIVDDGTLTVECSALGTRSMRLNASPPDALAKILLTELAYEAAERGLTSE